MTERIRCPFHQDQTASLIFYGKSFHCFGACSRRYSIKEVEAELGPVAQLGLTQRESIKENIYETLEYIKSLPKKEIRGFELPFDEHAYYLVWPFAAYYKRRYFNRDAAKYGSPIGHTPPLFVANQAKHAKELIIVEGEFNALALALACPDKQIVSPGAASNFTLKKCQRLLAVWAQYAKILIIADQDAAGERAARELSGGFTSFTTAKPTLALWEKDANEQLLCYGRQGLADAVKKAMEVQSRVCSDYHTLPASGSITAQDESRQFRAPVQRTHGTITFACGSQRSSR